MMLAVEVEMLRVKHPDKPRKDAVQLVRQRRGVSERTIEYALKRYGKAVHDAITSCTG
jgi:NACalpha-BTF3-like transcription factor